MADPIIRNPGGRSVNAVPLPEDQQFTKVVQRALTKIRVSKQFTLKPKSQTFVTVNTDQNGVIVVEPNKQLFDTNMFLLCTGVAQVMSNTDFRLLVANAGKHPKTLTVGQNFYIVAEHPTSIF